MSKGPSDEKITSIQFEPPATSTVDRAGKKTIWVPSGYKSEGEEKLGFAKAEKLPEATERAKAMLPSIHLGGPSEMSVQFDEMVAIVQRAPATADFPIEKYGLGPFGLTNDLYFGHTFWDLDVWMVPAFLFINPSAAKSAADYRLDRAAQARRNFNEWAKGKNEAFELGGMIFPWESSVSGREVCIQKTRNQQHISGDVVWGLTQCEAFGLANPTAVADVTRGVAQFYGMRSKQTARGREILDVTSPNEKFEGDNDLYTNLLAEWCSNGRRWSPRPTYYVPKDQQSLLNYDNDPMRDYQQAAGLLAIYPLQYPEAEREARTMLERFGDKISPNGPAMGHSVVATIWARLGEPEKAYAAWLDSWKPYTDNPNHYFSERRNVLRAYFYTGAAGAINTVIYGFAGFRIDRIPLPGAKWTKQLKSGWWLSVKPCVPKEIGQISMRGIVLDGKLYDFSMSSNGDFSVKPRL
ncbi:MAG: hypothetical protein JST12_06790 [Armatimonadetes bacterium]|nr:hypothetical protein [Armatimonadota bacterium]